MDGDGEERVWQGAEDGENKYKPLKKCLEVQVGDSSVSHTHKLVLCAHS